MIFIIDYREKGDKGDHGGQVVNGRIEIPVDLKQQFPNANYAQSLDELNAAKRVVLLCHGYNVSRECGVASFGRLAVLLEQEWHARTGQDADEVAFVVPLWPGDADVLSPAMFQFQHKQARIVGYELAKTLNDHADAGARVDFFAHSLGCEVVGIAAEHFTARLKRSVNNGNIIMAAAALDADIFSDNGPTGLNRVARKVRRVYILSSMMDEVLKGWYPLGNVASVITGDTNFRPALGLAGPMPRHRRPIPQTLIHTPVPNTELFDHDAYNPPIDLDDDLTSEQLRSFAWLVSCLKDELDPQV